MEAFKTKNKRGILIKRNSKKDYIPVIPRTSNIKTVRKFMKPAVISVGKKKVKEKPLKASTFTRPAMLSAVKSSTSGNENKRLVDDLKDILGTVNDTVGDIKDAVNNTEIKTNNTVSLDKGTKTFIGVVVGAVLLIFGVPQIKKMFK